jgi:hypothetical protein
MIPISFLPTAIALWYVFTRYTCAKFQVVTDTDTLQEKFRFALVPVVLDDPRKEPVNWLYFMTTQTTSYIAACTQTTLR